MTDPGYSRWYCTRCKRALQFSEDLHKHRDTVTAPQGSDGALHDQCGGLVMFSVREALEGAP